MPRLNTRTRSGRQSEDDDFLGDSTGDRGNNAATIKQGKGKKPSSAGTKIVVASKLPMALRIRNFDMVTTQEVNPKDGSVREYKVAEAREDQYIIHGTSRPRDGSLPRCRYFMGFALTEGVDKAAFDAWYEDNKNQPFIKNQLVFAMRDVSEAEAKARDLKGLTSKFEPLVDGDKRLPRSQNPESVSAIEPFNPRT